MDYEKSPLYKAMSQVHVMMGKTKEHFLVLLNLIVAKYSRCIVINMLCSQISGCSIENIISEGKKTVSF